MLLFINGCSNKERSNQVNEIEEIQNEALTDLLTDDIIDVKSDSIQIEDANATKKKAIKEKMPPEIDSEFSIDSAAKLILLGWNFWDFNDDNLVFSIMDSLLSEDTRTRLYYLPVFINIMKFSDGYVSEAVGGYSMRFVEKYPDEFIKLIDTTSDEAVNQFAFFIGSEIYLSSESEQEISNGKELANSLIEKSDSSDRILEFNDGMINIIEQNLK